MKRYNKYKPSGIEWLGDIPEHWEVKRVKDLTSVISKGTTPSTEGESLSDSGVRFVKAENIKESGIVANEPAFYITEETNNLLSRSKLKSNDLLMVIAGATTGKVAVIQKEQLPANTNQAVCFLRLKKTEITDSFRFKYYFINSSYFQSLVWLYSLSSAQPNLPMAVLSRISIYYPPLSEQTVIANYLDTKTTAIDRKIELLTAKADKYKALRRSLINETVCRGLNPNAPLKDSDIEWIGKIPAHWKVDRLKNLCIYISRGITPDYVENSEFKVINQATFSQGLFDEENIKFTTKSDKRAEAKVNDIIVASTGGGVLGKVYFIDVLSGKYFSDSHVTTIRTNLNRLNPKYLFYFLSINFDLINGIMAKGSTNQTELQRDSLLGFNWCVPPIEEQTAIAQYLNEKTTQIDTILTNINEQISKLAQLRKTLINDVVTGKIKVTEVDIRSATLSHAPNA